MSYRAAVALLVLAVVAVAPRIVHAAEPLPPGALLRFGDSRFRVGGPVERLEFSADGKQLFAWTTTDRHGRQKTTWDTTAWEPTRTTDDIIPVGAVIRWRPTSIPDTTRGVMINTDGAAVVRDFELNKDLVRLGGHFTRVTAVTVSPDGRRIATASADGLVRIWDSTTFRPVVEPKGHTAAVRGIEVSPDGRLVLTTSADGTARVWELATGRELRAFPTSGTAKAVFSADGTAVFVPGKERTIARDLVTGMEVMPRGGRRCELFPLGNWLLRQTGTCAALSPDGRTLAVGNDDGAVELIEAATGQHRRRLAGHAAGCLDLAFTPDGSRLVSAGADHAVFTWAVRVVDVPLTDAWKRETSATKLWDTLAHGRADAAYRAMARLAADPSAAAKMARLRLRPDRTTHAVEEFRAVELLETIASDDAKAFLRELASGEVDLPRTRAAAAALQRLGEPWTSTAGVRIYRGNQP